MNWSLIGLLVLNSVFSTAGDSISKLWATHPGPKWAVVTLGLSTLAAITWMLVVRRVGLTAGSAVMLLLTLIATALIGLLIFKEQITHGQATGIILGFLAALFLLNIIRIP
jgi:multidrug transporter EmrE-like cation transporter